MDVQLKELIETIKKEGVQTAEAQASGIVSEAEKKAKALVDAAREESRRLMEDAKAEAGRFREAAEAAVAQAGRDLVLRLQQSITRVFDELLKSDVKAALSGAVLEGAITGLVGAWQEKKTDELEVLLSQADHERVLSRAYARLAELMRQGIVFRPVPQLEAGFRIGEKNGSAFYDFSSEGIAQILAEFLNPRLASLIDEAVKKGN